MIDYRVTLNPAFSARLPKAPASLPFGLIRPWAEDSQNGVSTSASRYRECAALVRLCRKAHLLMLRLPNFGPPAAHFRRGIAALTASSGMHALVLAALAFAIVKTHRVESPETVTTSLVVPSGGGAGDGTDVDGSLANATLPQPGGRAAPLEAATDLTTPSGRLIFPTAVPNPADATGLLSAQSSSLEKIELLSVEESASEVSAPAQQLAAGNGGAAGEGGDGTGHSFFGLEASGEKVVFVVDISGSMHGRRFYRARNELQRSIETLREGQQFFVIFFNNDALPMPADKLLPATSSNISQTVQWLKYVECGGGTNPLPGLIMALQLHPDSIYLLTDGKFDPQIVWEVTQAEPPVPIPIYTISFASRSAEKLLRAIATETGGAYRFVK
jgi:von Willebrand factor type A domain